MFKILANDYNSNETTNRGKWLSAKIYSDTKKDCACGGKFTARMDILKIDMPVCDKCKDPPAFLRIRAKIEDEAGTVKYVDVRHNKNNERLVDAADCMVIFKQIQFELKSGTFKARDYDSAKSRDAFLFKNFSMEYLEFHKKRLDRGDLTPYGYKHKVKYIKVLLPFFGNVDIAAIKRPKIIEFQNSFMDKFTNRDKGLSELRTILKHAHLMEKISSVPPFDPIPASNIRETVLTIEKARELIPHIENEMYRLMISLIAEYALRPCEVRAIQFRDFDWKANRVSIKRHFSQSKLVEGRKSVKTGKNSSVSFSIMENLRKFVLTQALPLDSEEFIFRSPNGSPVFENTLPKAWARTLKRIGADHVQMYEMRHAKATEIIELSNGNISHARDFLGHSNSAITEKRYARSESQNDLYVVENDNVLKMVQ